MKKCSRCAESFPRNRDHFDGHRSTKDGLQTYCKTCRRNAQRVDYATWGHRHFPEVQAYLYGLAYLAHCRRELLEMAAPHVRGYAKRWNTEPDGSDFVHWLLSGDCGKICASKPTLSPWVARGYA